MRNLKERSALLEAVIPLGVDIHGIEGPNIPSILALPAWLVPDDHVVVEVKTFERTTDMAILLRYTWEGDKRCVEHEVTVGEAWVPGTWSFEEFS